MVGLKIPGRFRQTNITLKSDLNLLTFDQDGRPAQASILGELTAWGDALEEGEASDRFSTGEVRLWPQEEPFLRWLAPPVRWDGVGRTG